MIFQNVAAYSYICTYVLSAQPCIVWEGKMFIEYIIHTQEEGSLKWGDQPQTKKLSVIEAVDVDGISCKVTSQTRQRKDKFLQSYIARATRSCAPKEVTLV